MQLDDTIAAISSAAGPAARMIVRTSGPASFPAAAALIGGAFSPVPGSARLVRLAFAGLSVPAWVYVFAGPRSYSGEDMVEYHLPGNPLLCQLLLDALRQFPPDSPGRDSDFSRHPKPHNPPQTPLIRSAQAGEFTARAHFNGKLPLEAAEGVAAAIHASNQRELSAARRLLAGELAGRLAPLRDSLLDTLALVEAAIDFSDEGVSFLEPSELRRRVQSAIAALQKLLHDSPRLARLAHEPTVLLVGRPNAGKSTLLNTLCGTRRAIVSPEPGTTRDVIWSTAVLPRGLIHIADAAGLELPDRTGRPNENVESAGNLLAGRASDGGPSGQDGAACSVAPPSLARPAGEAIARQMQSHARRAAARADVLVLVRDSADARPAIALPRAPDLIVRSKIDLLVGEDCATAPEAPHVHAGLPSAGEVSCPIAISAHSGAGLSALRDALDAACFGDTAAAAESVALTARHVAAIESALAALARSEGMLSADPELLALELREALDAVGQILGELTPDDLLGRIFATFCIGK